MRILITHRCNVCMLQLSTNSVPAQTAKEISIDLDLGYIYKVRIVGVVG